MPAARFCPHMVGARRSLLPRCDAFLSTLSLVHTATLIGLTMSHSEAQLTKAAADYKRQQLSRKNLEEARRRAAASEDGYDSRATRQAMTSRFSSRSGGKRPYEWQLDVAEAFLLGLDCVVVAGTGAGKTIPYLLPLLLPETAQKMMPVISPLKSLQRDQVCILLCRGAHHVDSRHRLSASVSLECPR